MFHTNDKYYLKPNTSNTATKTKNTENTTIVHLIGLTPILTTTVLDRSPFWSRASKWEYPHTRRKSGSTPPPSQKM